MKYQKYFAERSPSPSYYFGFRVATDVEMSAKHLRLCVQRRRECWETFFHRSAEHCWTFSCYSSFGLAGYVWRTFAVVACFDFDSSVFHERNCLWIFQSFVIDKIFLAITSKQSHEHRRKHLILFQRLKRGLSERTTIIFGQSIKQILKKYINVTTLQDNK